MRKSAPERSIHHAAIGRHHILCVERRAIRKTKPLPHTDDPFTHVRPMVTEGKLENDLERPRIDREKRGEDKPRCAESPRLPDEARIELFRLAWDHDGQRTLA